MKKIALWVLVLAIVCFGAFQAFDSVTSLVPETSVKEVLFETNGVTTEQQVVELLGIEYGLEISDSVIKQYTKVLNALSHVRTATVSKESFGKLHIILDERLPLASTYKNGWGYLLDNGVYGEPSVYKSGALPVVAESKSSALLLKMLGKIKNADSTFYHIISEIVWNDTLQAAVLYVEGQHLKIYVGEDSDFSHLAIKYRALKEKGLCDTLNQNTIDMRFADFAYLQ